MISDAVFSRVKLSVTVCVLCVYLYSISLVAKAQTNSLQQNENIANIHETSQRPKAQGVTVSTDYGTPSPKTPERDSRRTPARRSELRASSELQRNPAAAAAAQRRAHGFKRRASKWFNSAGLLAHRPPCSFSRDCRAPGTGVGCGARLCTV